MTPMSAPTPAVPPGWYADPELAGAQRYWDGTGWTAHRAPAPAPTPLVVVTQAPGNGPAIAALVLGICGFVFTGIPLFVGLFLGGPLNILAVIFGIVGIVRSQRVGRGLGPAIVGLVLASVSIVAVFFGAGSIW